ncbi:MAG: peptidylprolyl isomerase [Anaerolineales bacterium]|nr:peptidylprolyl isomerase [Anaerolineales bacterium]
MAKRPISAPVNKKHLAREQRERRVRRWLVAGLAVTLTLIFGLLLFGWYDQAVLAPSQPLATVNGQEISARQVESRLRLLLLTGGEAATAADTALNQVIEDRLIEAEFEGRGLSVSEAEVQQSLEQAFGYFPQGTPTPRPSPTPDPTELALAALASTATPAAGASASPAPTAISLPTPTPFTQEAYRAALRQYLKTAGISEADLRDVLRASLVRANLQEALRAEVPREQEQTHARHILVKTEPEAQIVLKRLKDGESWEALAAELSLDEANKDQGGDLGWFGRNAMTPAFEEAAFAGKVGAVVGPVQTPFGWHLIDIQDRQVRTLDEFEYQLAGSSAFRAWLDTRRTEAVLDIADDWGERLLALLGG